MNDKPYARGSQGSQLSARTLAIIVGVIVLGVVGWRVWLVVQRSSELASAEALLKKGDAVAAIEQLKPFYGNGDPRSQDQVRFALARAWQMRAENEARAGQFSAALASTRESAFFTAALAEPQRNELQESRKKFLLTTAEQADHAKQPARSGEFYVEASAIDQAVAVLEKGGEYAQALALVRRHKFKREIATRLIVSWICSEAERGSVVNAVALARREAAVDDNLLEVFVAATTALSKAGKTTIAATMFEQANGWIQAAEAWISAGDIDRALALQRLGRISAQQLAEILVKLGHIKEAAALLESKHEPLEAAELYEKAGIFLEAARLYESNYAPHRAAACFERAGDFPAAARTWLIAGKENRAAGAFASILLDDLANGRSSQALATLSKIPLSARNETIRNLITAKDRPSNELWGDFFLAASHPVAAYDCFEQADLPLKSVTAALAAVDAPKAVPPLTRLLRADLSAGKLDSATTHVRLLISESLRMSAATPALASFRGNRRTLEFAAFASTAGLWKEASEAYEAGGDFLAASTAARRSGSPSRANDLSGVALKAAVRSGSWPVASAALALIEDKLERTTVATEALKGYSGGNSHDYALFCRDAGLLQEAAQTFETLGDMKEAESAFARLDSLVDRRRVLRSWAFASKDLDVALAALRVASKEQAPKEFMALKQFALGLDGATRNPDAMAEIYRVSNALEEGADILLEKARLSLPKKPYLAQNCLVAASSLLPSVTIEPKMKARFKRAEALAKQIEWTLTGRPKVTFQATNHFRNNILYEHTTGVLKVQNYNGPAIERLVVTLKFYGRASPNFVGGLSLPTFGQSAPIGEFFYSQAPIERIEEHVFEKIGAGESRTVELEFKHKIPYRWSRVYVEEPD